jgi:hypothetical protein
VAGIRLELVELVSIHFSTDWDEGKMN